MQDPPSAKHLAFLVLIEPIQHRLYHYALAVMGNTEDTRDLTSDTILAAFEQFDHVREPDKFLHLILTIASRKSKRRKYRSKKFIKLDESLTRALPSDGHQKESAAGLSVLLDLMQQRPQQARQTLLLFELEEMSLQGNTGDPGRLTFWS